MIEDRVIYYKDIQHLFDTDKLEYLYGPGQTNGECMLIYIKDQVEGQVDYVNLPTGFDAFYLFNEIEDKIIFQLMAV